MKSLKELYRIGIGPSSSHTIGPRSAAEAYLKRHPEALGFRVTLYGSLAATGKGHLTDYAILQVLGENRTELLWHANIVLPFHPNGMKFEASIVDDIQALDNGQKIKLFDQFVFSHTDLNFEHAKIYLSCNKKIL